MKIENTSCNNKTEKTFGLIGCAKKDSDLTGMGQGVKTRLIYENLIRDHPYITSV